MACPLPITVFPGVQFSLVSRPVICFLIPQESPFEEGRMCQARIEKCNTLCRRRNVAKVQRDYGTGQTPTPGQIGHPVSAGINPVS